MWCVSRVRLAFIVNKRAPSQMSRRFFLQLIVAIVKVFGDVGDSEEGYQALRILTRVRNLEFRHFEYPPRTTDQ